MGAVQPCEGKPVMTKQCLDIENLANEISDRKFKIEKIRRYKLRDGTYCHVQFISKWESYEEAKNDKRHNAIKEASAKNWLDVFAKGFIIGTRKGKVCFVSDSHKGLYSEFLEYIRSCGPDEDGNYPDLRGFFKHCG